MLAERNRDERILQGRERDDEESDGNIIWSGKEERATNRNREKERKRETHTHTKLQY